MPSTYKSVVDSDLGPLLREGFVVWRKNKVLCAPYVLLTVLTLGFLALLGGFMVVLWGFSFWAGLLSVFFVVPAFLAVVVVVPSFFVASSILMADKAVGGGKPVFGDCFKVGRDIFFRFVLVNLVVMILSSVFVGSVVFVASVFGVDFIFPATLLSGMAFIFAPYYVVIGKKDVFESLKSGFGLLKGNVLFVVLFWVFTYYVGLTSGILVLPVFLAMLAPLSLVAYLPVVGWGGFSICAAALGGVLFFAWFVCFLAPLRTVWDVKAYRALGGSK